MTDDQIELLLGRQRLAAPHPSLRARVIDAATGEPVRVQLGALDYALLATAACLLVGVIWSDVGNISADPLAMVYRDRLQEVADGLGGGQTARSLAVVVIAAEATRSEEREW